MLNMLSKNGSKERIIPLRLFFNINEEHHLPLISLQFPEIIIHINFAECDSANIKDASLNCEYVIFRFRRPS